MGLFDGAYENREMGFDGVSEGFSKAGMEEYLEALRLKLLIGVGEKLSETSGIVTALNAGWQGKSRDAFVKRFEAGIETVKEDLSQEYQNLLYKLAELTTDYYNQDSKMVDMI